MTKLIVSGLIKKRSEIAGEIQSMQADLKAIDRALLVFGFEDIESIAPRRQRPRPPLFKSGELISLIGEAERAGLDNNPDIADWIIQKKGWGASLYKRVWSSVKDCRKRAK